MRGWLYIIRNRDLYKIGITKNFDNRMRQLRPDCVISKLYTDNFIKLEKEFHKRYKDLRIPQTEYFRLQNIHIKEIKNKIRTLQYPSIIYVMTLVRSLCLVLILFLLVYLFNYLIINDLQYVLSRTLLLMKNITFFISYFSLFLSSRQYLSLFNEIKFRTFRFFIFFIFFIFF